MYYFVFMTKAQNQQKCRINCDKYLNNCSQSSTIMMKSRFYNTATSNRDVNIATWKERLHGWWETAVGINRRLLMWADSCRESRHQRKCSETKSAWSSQISTVSSLWHSHLQNRKVWWGRSLILPPFVPGVDTDSCQSRSQKSRTSTREHDEYFTWEMEMPVSFSTTSGTRVMMSSTSPDSLEAPTSPAPQDTMVTLRAAHRGLLISSAI